MDDAGRDDGDSGPGFFSARGVGYTYRWLELPGHWVRLLKAMTIDGLKGGSSATKQQG